MQRGVRRWGGGILPVGVRRPHFPAGVPRRGHGAAAAAASATAASRGAAGSAGPIDAAA